MPPEKHGFLFSDFIEIDRSYHIIYISVHFFTIELLLVFSRRELCLLTVNVQFFFLLP